MSARPRRRRAPPSPNTPTPSSIRTLRWFIVTSALVLAYDVDAIGLRTPWACPVRDLALDGHQGLIAGAEEAIVACEDGVPAVIESNPLDQGTHEPAKTQQVHPDDHPEDDPAPPLMVVVTIAHRRTFCVGIHTSPPLVGSCCPRSVCSHATRVRRGRSQGVAPGVPGCVPCRERAEKSDVFSAGWRDCSCVCSAASTSRLDPATPCRSGLKRPRRSWPISPATRANRIHGTSSPRHRGARARAARRQHARGGASGRVHHAGVRTRHLTSHAVRRSLPECGPSGGRGGARAPRDGRSSERRVKWRGAQPLERRNTRRLTTGGAASRLTLCRPTWPRLGSTAGSSNRSFSSTTPSLT